MQLVVVDLQVNYLCEVVLLVPFYRNGSPGSLDVREESILFIMLEDRDVEGLVAASLVVAGNDILTMLYRYQSSVYN